MKITNGNEDEITKKGLTMVLECDKKVTEEKIKFMIENRGDNRLVAGN